MDNIRAYGTGLASSQFDANAFFRKPTVIFRCIALICLYGSSASTCSFASALGFFSLVGAGALLLSDARFERVSSIPTRKRIVTGDLAVSVIFAGIFLIAFFTFWSKYSSFDLDEPHSTGYAKFGILLSFLSMLAWGGAAFFAWRRYEEGAVTALGAHFDIEFNGIEGEVQDGYGYGGSPEGIGAVSVANTSYQAGAPPIVPTNPNPFVGTDGYGY
ncbi:unnamed protein product [Nippostrongylus brasiliensis]|uniref:Synaptogyrin homolog 1 (inferred by orthology to a C. elegans protein) n=1 Tax=Nippostrongylus brasiliensis TaxID=27835 RepID=A0A0N4YHB4_NIPBR|nr:unnamed protein product [Nippostrongylus brasiliensis]